MNRKHASLAIALAAALSFPVFAESVGDGPGGSGGIGSGSPGGMSMGSSGASSPLEATPNSAMAGAVASSSPNMRDAGTISGTMLATAPSTTVLGAGPAGSTTVVTYQWVNVPANVEQRADFQRWMRLR